MPLNLQFFLPIGILLANEWCLSSAMWCSDGRYCSSDCCYDYDLSIYCCYNVANSWWFWFIWGVILLIILLTCCAVARRRQLRRRQVLVVHQSCTTPAAYGTLINTETPQQAYMQTGYNQYSNYAQPPYAPAPPYQPHAAEVQPAQPLLQEAGKQGQSDPNEKPPPYIP